ncbi:DUF1080 domain-containing protein [Marinilongibacter aquaticus]|uniref:family 16 glycoside hydrolase n=1 Tax=Marinilongibacter aquaticus TaxID=2975157 RepID=UPI0021BD1F32|nr:family 16 glycoside hydrolase [Marinilongibacter aquaticus]UBM60610.1 DUF1080 domain-containing protein [Marinilongibacter aquaticus]
MKKTYFLLTLLVLLSACRGSGQMSAYDQPDQWESATRKTAFNMGVIHMDKAPGSDVLWLKNSDFSNGTIELDIKGKNNPGASFVGLAFNGKSDKIYDAVYFRPFNFENPEKKTHMVQYIAMPHLDWKRLRDNYPGKYEAEIQTAPKPEDWFHVKLEIEFPYVKVYVNGAEKPALTVEQINISGHGKIGLWVGEGSEGWYKNLRFRETKSMRSVNVLMDVGHKQVFWNDPKSMQIENEKIARVYSMTEALFQTMKEIDGRVDYAYGPIDEQTLKDQKILFDHIPKAQYSEKEVKAIQHFLNSGGRLFLVMDSDYWSNLEETNVNDILAPYGIRFKGAIPDSLPGGHTVASPITMTPLKISYHEARIVEGGTPFCYGDQLGEKYPFGVYKELDGGGKLVIMSEAMTSLYMTSWQGVDDYQCQDFMQAVFGWLSK